MTFAFILENRNISGLALVQCLFETDMQIRLETLHDEAWSETKAL